MIPSIALRFIALALLTAAAHAAPHAQYQVIDLGTLPGGSFPVSPSEVNQANQTVGFAIASTAYRAFLHEQGVMRDLGIGTNGSFAARINERGQVIGTFTTDWDTITQGRDHAFLYSDGVLTDLSVQFNRYIRPLGINKRGQMVGVAETDDRSTIVSFVLTAGVLNLNPSVSVNYTDINDRGQITGFVSAGGPEPEDQELHPAIFVDGETQELPMPKGIRAAIATRINNHGTVIGYTTPRNEGSQGFIYMGGKTRLVRPLPGDVASVLNDVNNADVAVGQSRVPDDRSSAIIWRNGNAKDLNKLIPRRSGWVLSVASGINDRGVIVGSGLFGGEYHGFMLLPEGDDQPPRRN